MAAAEISNRTAYDVSELLKQKNMPERGKSRRQMSLLLLRSQCIRSVLKMALEGRIREAGEGRLSIPLLLD